MRTTPRRLAALVAAPAVSLALVAGFVPAAQADPSPAGTSAVGWMNGKLENGKLFPGDFSYGPNIDAGLAGLALGNAPLTNALRDSLAANIDSYISGDAFGDTGSTYANSVAKALSFAQQSGGNPTAFGGVDLVKRLEAQVRSGGADNGRIEDTSTYGDYANTLGQAFAAESLLRANSPKAAAATSFLLKQQCPDGSFRFDFADPAATDQSCTVNPGDKAADTTATVLLALQNQSGVATVKAAAGRAVAYLKTVQAADGSFARPDGTPNSNSTGLAGAALGESCALDAAYKAAGWVRAQQVQAGQTGPLASEVGAIAFGPSELAAAKTAGITDLQQFKLATAQAAPALAWDKAAPATVEVEVPAFVKNRDTVNVTVTGAAVGERVCLTTPAGPVAVDGIGGPLTVPVALPATGDAFSVSATTGPGAATGTVQLLGKKKLKLKGLPAKVKAGAAKKLKVKGLAAGETVRVVVAGRGKALAKGTANAKGVFAKKVTFKLKPGTYKLRVVGQFGNRKGVKVIRVVR